jgi:hypothetical protein
LPGEIDVNDRTLVSNMRFQLHDLRDELVGVRMRIMPGARTAAIERARRHLQDACAELELVLDGRLEGDHSLVPTPELTDAAHDLDAVARLAEAGRAPAWVGIDLARVDSTDLVGDARK